MRFYILLILACAVPGGAGAGELTTNDLQQARMQGSNALASLKRRIKPDNAVGMGFSSTNEAQGAVLGEPFRVYQVPKDRLVTYNGTQTFASLLEPAGRVIFPAEVNGSPKSTIIVSQAGGAWRTEKFGDPSLIHELTGARQKVAATNASLASSTFAVEIPVASFWFLGFTNLASDSVVVMVTTNLTLGPVSRTTHELVTTNLMNEFRKIAQRYSGASN
jgi:hypothetical protein